MSVYEQLLKVKASKGAGYLVREGLADDDDIGLGPINKTVLLLIGLAMLIITIFMLAYHQKTKKERVTEEKVKEKEEPDKKKGKEREYKGRRKKKWV